MSKAKTKATLEQIMRWEPHHPYSKDRIAELFDRRGSLSAIDILKWKIPNADRLWFVLRKFFLTEKKLHEIGCKFIGHSISHKKIDQKEIDYRLEMAYSAKLEWIEDRISEQILLDAKNNCHIRNLDKRSYPELAIAIYFNASLDIQPHIIAHHCTRGIEKICETRDERIKEENWQLLFTIAFLEKYGK